MEIRFLIETVKIYLECYKLSLFIAIQAWVRDIKFIKSIPTARQ